MTLPLNWAFSCSIERNILLLMQFRLIRGQIRGQFIRNSGATVDDGATAGSVTRAAAASPRAGTQGIRRCVGCRRGHLQAAAAGPPRAANLTSATGEFDLGARALVTTLVPSAYGRAVAALGSARTALVPDNRGRHLEPSDRVRRLEQAGSWHHRPRLLLLAAACSTAAAAAAADSHCLLAAATACCRD